MNPKFQEQVAHAQGLVFDARVVGATIVALEKGNRPTAARQYFAGFLGKPNVMMKNYVRLTARREESDDPDRMFQGANLLGIPLGKQVVQDNLADHSPQATYADKLWSKQVMLLVKEVERGCERVGIATFDSTDTGYFIPSTLQLADGSTVRKTFYSPETYRRIIPFF